MLSLRRRGFGSCQEFHRPGCATKHELVYKPEGIFITHVVVTFNREIQQGHSRARWYQSDCEWIHGAPPFIRKYANIRRSVWTNEWHGEFYENYDKPSYVPTEKNSEYKAVPDNVEPVSTRGGSEAAVASGNDDGTGDDDDESIHCAGFTWSDSDSASSEDGVTSHEGVTSRDGGYLTDESERFKSPWERDACELWSERIQSPWERDASELWSLEAEFLILRRREKDSGDDADLEASKALSGVYANAVFVFLRELQMSTYLPSRPPHPGRA